MPLPSPRGAHAPPMLLALVSHHLSSTISSIQPLAMTMTSPPIVAFTRSLVRSLALSALAWPSLLQGMSGVAADGLQRLATTALMRRYTTHPMRPSRAAVAWPGTGMRWHRGRFGRPAAGVLVSFTFIILPSHAAMGIARFSGRWPTDNTAGLSAA